MWRSINHRNLVIAVCVMSCFMAQTPCFSSGADTLSRGQSITETQTLTSKQGIFELGFFKLGTNSYLGICFKDFPNKTVVWVANREKPLPNISGFKLELVQNGNLALHHDSDSIWSTSLMTVLPETVEAVLLDTGNLILRDGSSPHTVFWQSFDYPTHAWLPGALLGVNKITKRRLRLVSWKSVDDPSPGSFSLEISHDQTYSLSLMWNMSTVYWSSGGWNGVVFGSVPELSYLASFSFPSTESITYSVLNPMTFSMFVVDPSGDLRQLTSFRNISMRNWIPSFELPKKDVFGFCGAFGIFSDNHCTCLQGFAPLLPMMENGRLSGCSRRSILQCENGDLDKGRKDGFLRISDVNFPANPISHSAQSAKSCMLACQLDCSCTAYAFNQKGCSVWQGALLNLKNVSNIQGNKDFMYLKLAQSELQNGRKKLLEVIIAVVVPIVVVFSGGALGCFYNMRNKQKEGKEQGEDLLSFDFDLSVKQPSSSDGMILTERNSINVDLPVFNYASVSAATKNFSPENKLGEGGFGSVYKGKLLNGQEVALKRLSKKSGQGFNEFRNEILFIAKLQHRNLVRLLGCCIDPEESILIYEYMPNKSLDFFLFDPNKNGLLDWPTRLHIVEGIAQGLLYLHEYSRVRIIHRDLKASNILLDGEMNPKISDFGMARIFGGNDSRAHTNKIVGTYGYMAPEYALQGISSIKSDVFSFGVLVLEIISGKKNTGFYQTESLSLVGHAWDLWNSDRGVELVDQKVEESMVLRYINVGLLCVQEKPNDRPTMSSVVSMLNSEIAPLPTPKRPAFCSASSLDVKHSVNGLTVSSIQPR